ncbi:MAG: hypothetical protein QOF42_1620 [Gammaproteobacteria bacterium]|jgi:hypothetical protein|nr:hypothetical protein [Gammaproteobacteria bacterium]
MRSFICYASLGAVVSLFGGCSPHVNPTPPLQHPVASIQELMQAVVDPSADGVWNAVETTLTNDGETVQQPRTDAEWLEVRRAALILVESANLLEIEGRRVGARDFPAEAAGVLDSAHIQELIDAQRSTFNGFAVALRLAALTTLSAIDAKDPTRLVSAGGAIDQVCEGCHLKFWYPNQVIPSLPNSPRTAFVTSSAMSGTKQLAVQKAAPWPKVQPMSQSFAASHSLFGA